MNLTDGSRRQVGHDGPVLYNNRARAGSFGEDAEAYDSARPTYPAALVDDLLAGGALSVLDVGCGTGIVSRLFTARGKQVLGVEPDPRMAQVARSHGLEVETATFEEWDDAGRRFDLLVAGQAWHWVDPVVGAAKAARVLRPGGRIGLFWNRGRVPDGLRQEIDAAYRELAPELTETHPQRQLGPAESLRADGRFRSVQLRAYPHVVEYTTASWLALLPTHSNHRLFDPERRARLLDRIGECIDAAGGHFVIDYNTALVTAVTEGT